MASKFETESISYVKTLLHRFSSTTFLEATAGVNWGHQCASPFNQAALDANNGPKWLPGLPQFFPEANPLDLLPNATFNGGIPMGGTASIGLFQYERRFPFYGYNTLWNFSGSLTRVAEGPQHQDRHLRRARGAAGAAAVGLQRHLQFQRRRIASAQHERRVRQRPARRGHVVSAGGQAARSGTASSSTPSSTPRTTGASARGSPSTRASASTTSPRSETRAARWRSSSRSTSIRPPRRCSMCRSGLGRCATRAESRDR